MYCGHARLCVCLSAAACPHYCTDPDVTWGSGRGCSLVVHCWADLQSVHGWRCYGSITRNVSEYMLVLVVCQESPQLSALWLQSGCWKILTNAFCKIWCFSYNTAEEMMFISVLFLRMWCTFCVLCMFCRQFMFYPLLLSKCTWCKRFAFYLPSSYRWDPMTRVRIWPKDAFAIVHVLTVFK